MGFVCVRLVRIGCPSPIRLTFAQVALAVARLHSQHIVHSDIKAENVVIDEMNGEEYARLGDFGLSNRRIGVYGVEDISGAKFTGTPAWSAPEVLSGNKPSAFSDCELPRLSAASDVLPTRCPTVMHPTLYAVYSLGVTIWEVLSQCTPFYHDGFADLSLSELTHRVCRGERPPIDRLPPDTPASIRTLIVSLLCRDPGKRPPASAVAKELHTAAASLGHDYSIALFSPDKRLFEASDAIGVVHAAAPSGSSGGVAHPTAPSGSSGGAGYVIGSHTAGDYVTYDAVEQVRYCHSVYEADALQAVIPFRVSPFEPFPASNDLQLEMSLDSQLAEALPVSPPISPMRTTLICGAGGLGKTSAVSQFFSRELYPGGGVWINAASTSLIEAGYRDILRRLRRLPDRASIADDPVFANILSAVFDALVDSERDRFLLVFDNADSLDVLSSLVFKFFPPRHAHCDVIITTRHAPSILPGILAQERVVVACAWSTLDAMRVLLFRSCSTIPGITSSDIDIAASDPGALAVWRRLLCRELSIEEAFAEHAAASSIAGRMLCGHPLAIAQAAAFVARSPADRSFVTCMQGLTDGSVLRRPLPTSDADLPRLMVGASMELSIKHLSPVAKCILILAAACDAESIPITLLCVAAKTASTILSDLDDAYFTNRVAELMNASLLVRGIDSSTVSMHRLQHSLLRCCQQTDADSVAARIEMLAQSVCNAYHVMVRDDFLFDSVSVGALAPELYRALQGENCTFGDKPGATYARQCLPHAIYISDNIVRVSDSTSYNSAGADLVQATATLLRARGAFNDAFSLQDFVLNLRRARLGTDAPETLSSMDSMARLLYVQGELVKSESLCTESLSIRKRLHRDSHVQISRSSINMAALLVKQWKLGAAEQLLTELREIHLRVLPGVVNAETLELSNLMAVVLHRSGRYAEAKILYAANYEHQCALWDKNHVQTLLTATNLGLILRDSGRPREANGVLKAVFDARSSVFGELHPDTLKSMNNLATTHHAMGDLEQAESLFRRALDARRCSLGDAHNETLKSVNDLANLLVFQGKLSEAEKLLRICLESRQVTLTDAHPDSLQSLNNLARLYHYGGRYVEAEALYDNALSAFQSALGGAHPYTLCVLSNKAALLCERGDCRAAEPLSLEALELRREVLGPCHPDTLRSANNTAILLLAQENVAAAELLCCDTLNCLKAALGPTHPDTLCCAYNLAIIFCAQGKICDAERLWHDTIAGVPGSLGMEHPFSLACATAVTAWMPLERDPPCLSVLHRMMPQRYSGGLLFPKMINIIGSMWSL